LQVEFFNPAQDTGSKAAGSSSAVEAAGLASLFGPAECAGIEAASESILELQKEASSLVLPPDSAASWKAWAASVAAAAEGEVEDQPAASAGAVRSLLQAKLEELEAALLSESKGGLEADGESSGVWLPPLPLCACVMRPMSLCRVCVCVCNMHLM
jgi:hypothetical protein